LPLCRYIRGQSGVGSLRGRSGGAQILSCRLAGAAVGDDVEKYFLPPAGGAHASAFDGADMNKDNLCAVFPLDEAEAFLVVKPLHNTRVHRDILSLRVCTWNVANEISPPLFRFVDFGEASEACAPVSNEANRPSRSAKVSIGVCRGAVALFQGKSV